MMLQTENEIKKNFVDFIEIKKKHLINRLNSIKKLRFKFFESINSYNNNDNFNNNNQYNNLNLDLIKYKKEEEEENNKDSLKCGKNKKENNNVFSNTLFNIKRSSNQPKNTLLAISQQLTVSKINKITVKNEAESALNTIKSYEYLKKKSSKKLIINSNNYEGLNINSNNKFKSNKFEFFNKDSKNNKSFNKTNMNLNKVSLEIVKNTNNKFSENDLEFSKETLKFNNKQSQSNSLIEELSYFAEKTPLEYDYRRQLKTLDNIYHLNKNKVTVKEKLKDFDFELKKLSNNYRNSPNKGTVKSIVYGEVLKAYFKENNDYNEKEYFHNNSNVEDNSNKLIKPIKKVSLPSAVPKKTKVIDCLAMDNFNRLYNTAAYYINDNGKKDIVEPYMATISSLDDKGNHRNKNFNVITRTSFNKNKVNNILPASVCRTIAFTERVRRIYSKNLKKPTVKKLLRNSSSTQFLKLPK